MDEKNVYTEEQAPLSKDESPQNEPIAPIDKQPGQSDDPSSQGSATQPPRIDFGTFDLTEPQSKKKSAPPFPRIIAAAAFFLLIFGITSIIFPFQSFKIFPRFIYLGVTIAVSVILFCVAYKTDHCSLNLCISALSVIVCIFTMCSRIPVEVEINSKSDFSAMFSFPSANYATFHITEDIDMKGSTPRCWGRIDDFHGTIDGGGHTVSNISVKKKAKNSCLIETLHGTIENLTFENLTLTYDNSSQKNSYDEDNDLIGGLTMINRGTIKNVSIEGLSFYADQGKKTRMGVFTAVNYGEITEVSLSDAILKVDSAKLLRLGGVSANNYGTISDSHIKNTYFCALKLNSYRYNLDEYFGYIGGFAAMNSAKGGTITGCTYENDIVENPPYSSHIYYETHNRPINGYYDSLITKYIRPYAYSICGRNYGTISDCSENK